MKIRKSIFLIAILLAALTTCTQKQEPVEEKAKQEKETVKKEKQKPEPKPVEKDSLLSERLEEVEQLKKTLAQKEDSLESELAVLEDRKKKLSKREEILQQREKEAQKMLTTGRWMLIIGAVLFVIAIILFVLGQRRKTEAKEKELPPQKEEGKGEPATEEEQAEEQEVDPLYHDAVELVLKNQRASASFIQKELKIGYRRANVILNSMEEKGLVGSSVPNKAREVLVSWKDYK